MNHFNKKVIPAIVLIILVMIIGFAIQYTQTENVVEEDKMGAQQVEYTQEINACQVAKEQGTQLSKECVELLDK